MNETGLGSVGEQCLERRKEATGCGARAAGIEIGVRDRCQRDRCQKEIGVKDPVTPNLSSDSHNPSMLQQVATSQRSSATGGGIRTPLPSANPPQAPAWRAINTEISLACAGFLAGGPGGSYIGVKIRSLSGAAKLWLLYQLTAAPRGCNDSESQYPYARLSAQFLETTGGGLLKYRDGDATKIDWPRIGQHTG